MLVVEMLPAAHGDCLWIEYGMRRRVRRVLIDGGTTSTYPALRERIAALPADDRHFELLVITHIDADHIGGVISLLQDQALGVTFGDVWFNGYAQLQLAGAARGAVQAETLSAILTVRQLPWNAAFNGGFIAVPEDAPLPLRRLRSGLRLTLLSPTRRELIDLVPRWEHEVAKAGLAPGAGVDQPDTLLGRGEVDLDEPNGPLEPEQLAAEFSRPDSGEPNGSSIAFLAEFRGRGILLSGDAYASTLARSIGRLAAERGLERLPLAALKLPHHGSQGNVTQELLERVSCRRYLVSTSGARFRHPDRQAVARVLVHGGPRKALYFNYRTPYTAIWSSQPGLQERYDYGTAYPNGSGAGLRVAV
jgi:beta-lactamase superfamily II metal-dependent hydrolase